MSSYHYRCDAIYIISRYKGIFRSLEESKPIFSVALENNYGILELQIDLHYDSKNSIERIRKMFTFSDYTRLDVLMIPEGDNEGILVSNVIVQLGQISADNDFKLATYSIDLVPEIMGEHSLSLLNLEALEKYYRELYP